VERKVKKSRAQSADSSFCIKREAFNCESGHAKENYAIPAENFNSGCCESGSLDVECCRYNPENSP